MKYGCVWLENVLVRACACAHARDYFPGLDLHEVEADVFPFLCEKQKNMSSNCNESFPGNKD